MRGKDVTPFVLDHLHRASEGATLAVNVRLVLRNAELAGQIAAALAAGGPLSSDPRVVVVGDVATDVVAVLAGDAGARLGPAGVHPQPRRRRGRERRGAPGAAGRPRRAGRLHRGRRRRGRARRGADAPPGCGWRCGPCRAPRPARSSAWSSRTGSAACSPTAGPTWRCGPATCRLPGRRSPAPLRLHAARPAAPRRRSRGAGRGRRGRRARCRSTRPRPARSRAYGVDRWLADTAAATLLLPNADEARLLTGCRRPRRTRRGHWRSRHPIVAVSLGADGALWASRDVLVHRPAHDDGRRRHHGRRGRVRRGTAGGLAAGSPAVDPAAALDAGLARAAAVVRRPGAR